MTTEKIRVTVTMENVYQYSAQGYCAWQTETRYIYTMKDESGKTYVWKTTAFMTLKEEAPDGWEIDSQGRTWAYREIRKGDRVTITASVKGEGEYKGEPQTELARVKVVERISKGETREEEDARKAAERENQKREQLETIRECDFVWRMPYRQYKEHYADCETVIDSYENIRGHKTIEVIIRAGRLVASGTRGQHYRGFEITFTEEGKPGHITYRAITEENALKRLAREYPEAQNAECVKIYNYI